MRPFLTALLLLFPAASAATLTQTTPIPGHAGGSFGTSDEPNGPLTGGAAWSADSQTVFTLDTTRELKRWRASDGRLLRGQRLSAPAALPDTQDGFPTTGLNLSGVADAYGLPLTARGYRGDQQVALHYRLNTGSGQVTPQPDCPPSLQTGLTCTLDGTARVWISGGELQWQRGGQTQSISLPVDLALSQSSPSAPFALALSSDGRRAALLALRGEETVFGGQGVLLSWTLDASGQVQTRQTELSGPKLFSGATLYWVGERLLLASNVFNTGDEYGSGGAKRGQQLSLVAPGDGPVWTLNDGVGLRGVYPSPDGQRFVSIQDGSVPEVRRVSDGGFVRSLGEAVLDTAPLSGGRTLMAVQGGGGSGRVALHQPGRLTTLFRGRANVVAASHDGSRFVTADGKVLRLHDSAGKVLRAWQAEERVSKLAFSPDGRVLSAQLGWDWEDSVQAWRVADGTAYALPPGTWFPVSDVLIRRQEREGVVVQDRSADTALWTTPKQNTGGLYALPSPDGQWLAQFGMTEATISAPLLETLGESRRSRFSRVAARTGQSGPVLSVPVEHPDDVYAGWGLNAFDGRRVLLAEGSGDGCGGVIYGYKLADLAAGRILPTPAQLRDGYDRFIGCGVYNFRPEAAFAPDGRLLIQDGNRLDWYTFAQ